MPDKEQILDLISAIARRLGRAPSRAEFVSLAGIPGDSVSKFFPRWNEAVRAARLKPRTPGPQQIQESELLRDRGETGRRKRDLPSRPGHRLAGKHDPRT